ncbi:hypothetical protein FHL15_003205 [Xylaria flabelliformis]|uniref:Restriction endonuclease domain-containing protein n=1 Tax=Xylaria flabelliformis TaxID=2512241 RepID=A0A553I796_9PEZI|nr:hypothetical protein FHL15_003205 [Xylaria flabelliformis]
MASESPSFSVSILSTTVASDIDQKDDMPTIRFTNAEALFDAVRQVDVPLADFEDLSLREKRPFRIRRYHADQGLLILTIPTDLHEALHLELWNEYSAKLAQNNQRRDWKAIGSTTFRSRGRHSGDGGEGDSSGGPVSERGPKGSWPTLVIEAGDSESSSALRDDMRWWFSASNHDVKIVLLTKFDHQNQTIIIERWEEELQNRQGATRTRQETCGIALQPVLQQSIGITRDIATDSYHVTSGALILSFRLLFLQPPGPLQGDYIISIAQLQAYARAVWKNV